MLAYILKKKTLINNWRYQYFFSGDLISRGIWTYLQCGPSQHAVRPWLWHHPQLEACEQWGSKQRRVCGADGGHPAAARHQQHAGLHTAAEHRHRGPVAAGQQRRHGQRAEHTRFHYGERSLLLHTASWLLCYFFVVCVCVHIMSVVILRWAWDVECAQWYSAR